MSVKEEEKKVLRSRRGNLEFPRMSRKFLKANLGLKESAEERKRFL